MPSLARCASWHCRPAAVETHPEQDLSFYAQLLVDLGGDNADMTAVYFGTVFHVLPSAAAADRYRDIATLTKGGLPTMPRESVYNPAVPAVWRGRPRTPDGSPVDFVVVAKEKHADGSPHFHFVVKLLWALRFKPAKDALRESYSLPSHWFCTHAQFPFATRYVHQATPQKPDVPLPPCVETSFFVLAILCRAGRSLSRLDTFLV